MVTSWQESYGKPRQCVKKQRHHFAEKDPSSQGYGLFSSHVRMRKLDHKEVRALKNWCFWTVVLEKTLERPWTARSASQSWRKSTLNTHWKDWYWSWSCNTLATWCQQQTHWKRPWCWERLKAGGEEGNRGWDRWMASPIQWTWTWANSGRWWGTGKPGMLQSMGLRRVRHDLATEQQQNKCSEATGRIQPILNRKPWCLQFLWLTKRKHRRRGMETFASYLLVTVDVF